MVSTLVVSLIEIPAVAIITIFFMELLPNNIKLWVQYQARNIKKFSQRPSVDLTLIGKTADLSLKKIEVEKLVPQLSEKLGQAGYSVAVNGFNLVWNVTEGDSEARIELSPAVTYEDVEEEQEDGQVITRPAAFVTQLQLSLYAKAKFHGLSDHLLELREAQGRIIDSIRDTVSFQPNRILTCKLNSVNELTGMLSKYNINLLSANYDKTRIDLAGDKLIIYSESLTSPVVALLRKMIVMYY